MRRALLWSGITICGLAATGKMLDALAERRFAKKYPPPGRFVSAKGERVHYVRQGDKKAPALAFLHGVPGSVIDWQTVQPLLAQQFNTFAVDRPGYGWSRAMPRLTNSTLSPIRINAAWTRHAFDKTALRRPVVLVAHGYGSAIALTYAALYPADVSAIVLLEPAPPEWSAHPRCGTIAGLLLRFIAAWGGQYLCAPLLRLPHAATTSLRSKEWQTAWRAMTLRGNNLRALAAIADQATSTPDLAKLVPHIKTPVLILSAEKSRKESYQRDLAAQLPNVKREVVPHTGHYLQLDRPEEVAARIAAFVAQV